ncbi:MAG: hypothetical protein K0Q51_1548, partial [Rickettsiaceae bacterium]|nr:hypothetical protein [Rickettsiaceae bacterium]
VQVNWFESDMFLVQALRLVLLIDGRQELLNDYREGTVKNVEKNIIRKRALEKLKNDLKQFSLKLGNEEEGKLINVKQDIFRIADRIIDDLADYYELKPATGRPGLTVWEVISYMKNEGILSKEGAQHLKEAISIATELRIATYCHNNGQKENVSTFVPALEHLSENQKKLLLEETFYIKDTSILYHFYYVMLRVQFFVICLCFGSQYDLSFFKVEYESLFDQNDFVKGMVYAKFLEYDKAVECLQKAEVEDFHPIFQSFELLNLYIKISSLENSIRLGERIYYLLENIYKDNLDQPEIAAILNNLGLAYTDKGNYEQAIECYNKSLFINLKNYQLNPDNYGVAINSCNLAKVYGHMGDYEKAIEYYNGALDIFLKDYNKSFIFDKIGIIMSSLGVIYRNKGEYEKAIQYHKVALAIQLKTFVQIPNHPNIAESYTNLGCVFSDHGSYEQAILCHNRALDILLKVYKQIPNHPLIAVCYNNIGFAYNYHGNYKRAIEYINKALSINLRTYEESPNHPEIASSYINLGNVCYHSGNYNQAEEHYKKALAISQKAYQNNPNHPDLALIYTCLGVVYSDVNFKKAIKYYKKALEIRLRTYAQNPKDPEIINIYNNLGEVYGNEREHKEAIEYYNKALDVAFKTHEYNPTNPIIAVIYNNLGNEYDKEQEYEQAIMYHEKALNIRLEAYKFNPYHPYIAASYLNLGATYRNKGDYEQAIKYDKQALNITLKAYECFPSHPQIAVCYNNLGFAYSDKGDFEQAIMYHEKALRIRLKAYAQFPNHKELGTSYYELASLFARKGKYQQSYDNALKALEIFSCYKEESIIQELKAMSSTALNQLSKREFLNGNSDFGKNLYVKLSLEHTLITPAVTNKMKEKQNEEKIIAGNEKGVSFYLKKDFTKAISEYTKCLNLINKLSNSDQLLDKKIILLFNRARSYELSGDLVSAILDYKLYIELKGENPKAKIYLDGCFNKMLEGLFNATKYKDADFAQNKWLMSLSGDVLEEQLD